MEAPTHTHTDALSMHASAFMQEPQTQPVSHPDVPPDATSTEPRAHEAEPLRAGGGGRDAQHADTRVHLYPSEQERDDPSALRSAQRLFSAPAREDEAKPHLCFAVS